MNYTYQPLFGTWFVGQPNFRREAAYIIRDDRSLGASDKDGISDATTAAKASCS